MLDLISVVYYSVRFVYIEMNDLYYFVKKHANFMLRNDLMEMEVQKLQNKIRNVFYILCGTEQK